MCALNTTLVLPGGLAANEAHRPLLALSPDQQVRALVAVVSSSGYTCKGRSVEFKGIETPRDRAFWRVDCSGGQSYLVGIDSDAAGSTGVLPCSVSAAMGGDTCFVKWK